MVIKRRHLSKPFKRLIHIDTTSVTFWLLCLWVEMCFLFQACTSNTTSFIYWRLFRFSNCLSITVTFRWKRLFVAFGGKSRLKVPTRKLVMIASNFSHFTHVRKSVSPHYCSDFGKISEIARALKRIIFHNSLCFKGELLILLKPCLYLLVRISSSHIWTFRL